MSARVSGSGASADGSRRSASSAAFSWRPRGTRRRGPPVDAVRETADRRDSTPTAEARPARVPCGPELSDPRARARLAPRAVAVRTCTKLSDASPNGFATDRAEAGMLLDEGLQARPAVQD
eukprot:CAMPEP_0197403700 /NCGR_PEP_ID=MMETSP1165-20131217/21899_1 /TAXON_ID=284809 /ORGANISM="Chrysocystis fragilis, Strain CCMP3189" /LENGTH=120 /DNA_ID=CAMNT_0042929923 /DNA_START=468 /DNA_END=829 /DNA_ORIENTATION=-